MYIYIHICMHHRMNHTSNDLVYIDVGMKIQLTIFETFGIAPNCSEKKRGCLGRITLGHAGYNYDITMVHGCYN